MVFHVGYTSYAYDKTVFFLRECHSFMCISSHHAATVWKCFYPFMLYVFSFDFAVSTAQQCDKMCWISAYTRSLLLIADIDTVAMVKLRGENDEINVGQSVMLGMQAFGSFCCFL